MSNRVKTSVPLTPTRLNAFVFDQFQSGYYSIGEKVGQAWSSGKGFGE